MATPLQAKSAKAIVDVFETGFARGDYAAIAAVPGDTGGLSYGRAQATRASGALGELVARYHHAPGARFAALVEPHLAALAAREPRLDGDLLLANALRVAADDPVMRELQDAFFDERYWEPSVRTARALGLAEPLSLAVVYDGFVHGSFETMRRRTEQADGTVAALGERAWVLAYVARRRAWLAGHRRRDLRAAVSRMDAFRTLAESGLWSLPLPLVVRGRVIDDRALEALPPTVFDGPPAGTRAIVVATPLFRGHDVRLVQDALARGGFRLVADGLYGPVSRDAVVAFQALHGLAATGAVEETTLTALAIRRR